MWVVCRTHPNSEKIAIRNLQNQSFDYYQPLILEYRKTRQGMQKLPAPLFPCYLFINVTDRWACLKNTYGIASLIMFGGNPAWVRDHVIEDLRRLESNGFVALPKQQRFRVGDQVKISSGPFMGEQALVERMSSRERQKCLLALLNGSIRVLVEEQNLEAA